MRLRFHFLAGTALAVMLLSTGSFAGDPPKKPPARCRRPRPRRGGRHCQLRRSGRRRGNGEADRQDSWDSFWPWGDLAYPDGSEENFAKCYGPTWGRFKDRTRPARAITNITATSVRLHALLWYGGGDPKQGYYSYDLGAWHIIALNSHAPKSAAAVRPHRKDNGSSETWNSIPRGARSLTGTFHYSVRGKHGNDPEMKPLWDALYHAGAEVVLNGHDHDYERFALQDPDG